MTDSEAQRLKLVETFQGAEGHLESVTLKLETSLSELS